MSTDYDPVRRLAQLGLGVLAASVRDGTEVTIHLKAMARTAFTAPRLPGYSRPPYPVTPWEIFTPDPDWAGSDLRNRGSLVRSLRNCAVWLLVSRSVIRPGFGILESGFRPV